MKIAAIIAEYNPFHNGHKYQIDKLREILGEDTAVIAIMSGNYTQRGEIAIADKSVRSRAAVDCGVDLVLELPFPFSMASAEFFSAAGVHIANSLGVVDYLVFGCECSTPELLEKTAEFISTDAFADEIARLESLPEYRGMGYPALVEAAYTSLSDTPLPEGFFSQNNILALEYLKALYRLGSCVKPLPITRVGAAYSSEEIVKGERQSATAIRHLIAANDKTAYDYMPICAKNVFVEAREKSEMPTSISALDVAVISHFRLNPTPTESEPHDAKGGLYNRLYDKSLEAVSISSLTKSAETKKFTKARIRRAVLYSYLGVTSSELETMPLYTQVLAMNSTGRALLRQIKRAGKITVLTKPAAYKECSALTVRQKELSDRADSVFALTHGGDRSGTLSLTFTPYVKK